MPHIIRINLIPFLLVVGMASGCASSSGDSRSADYPDRDSTAFSNFLVAAIAENYNNRAQFERTVVSALRNDGASATAYYEAVGGNEPVSRERIRELIVANGYDAVLITRVLDSRQQVELKQGSTAAKITRRDDRPADFFRYDYEELDEPPRLDIRAEAKLASELYRAADQNKVWSTEVSNTGADNVGELIDEVADDIVKRLRRSKHMAR